MVFAEVMIERVDEMKKIIEHANDPAGGEASIFALHSPLLEADCRILITGQIGTRRWKAQSAVGADKRIVPFRRRMRLKETILFHTDNRMRS
jgi:hypothetical protein